MSTQITKQMFVGRWVTWCGSVRTEQELFDNGLFEGMSLDEEDAGGPCVRAKGTWEVVDGAIHWRYTETEGIPLPKKVDINPIVHVDKQTFSVRESNRRQSDWYRFVKGEDTSTNLDMEQVEPLCKRIAGFIDSGFGEQEIAALMKKLSRLKP